MVGITVGLALMVVGILMDPKARRGVGVVFLLGAIVALVSVVVVAIQTRA